MKTFLAVFASLCVLSARAGVTFSAGIDIHVTADFYQPLASHGAWVDVSPYGRCWHPSQVEVSWRPYSIGHWEWTDCGCTINGTARRVRNRAGRDQSAGRRVRVHHR